MTDIDNEVEHSFSSSYADDTRVMSKINSTEDITLMQSDLNAIYTWSSINNMICWSMEKKQ